MEIIGRDGELTILRQAIEQCRGGQAGLVLISGPAGVGKTALTQEALREEDLFFLETRLLEEEAPPFGPLVTAVRHLIRTIEAGELKLLDYLGRLLPELAPAEVSSDKHLVVSAIREIFQCAARRQPVVLVMEDIHWADESTLEVLPQLFEGIRDFPFLIITTLREEAASGPRQHRQRLWRAGLRRLPWFRELRVEPLDAAATRRMAETLLRERISDGLASLLFQFTQGIPLYLDEILRALRQGQLLLATPEGLVLHRQEENLPVPETIRDAIALRLDGLSPLAREQLEIAAAIGQEFEFELLVAITGTEEGVDELLRRRLIFERSPGLGSFSHSLTREAIRNEILWSRRRAIYRSIAEALSQRDASPELTANFWLRAGRSEEARRAFLTAALDYCRLQAHADSARTARQALELWPRGEEEELRLQTMQNLAHCTQVSGQLHDAVMVLREITDSPLLRDAPRRLAETYRSLANCYGLQSTWQQYKESRRLAALHFEAAGMSAEAAAEWLELTDRHLTDLELPEAAGGVEKARRLSAITAATDLEARVLGVRGFLLAIQGQAGRGQQMAQEAVLLALRGGDPQVVSEAYRRLAGTYEYGADFNAAMAAYDKALELCNTPNLAAQARSCLGCMSWVLFRLGDWKRCLEVGQEAADRQEKAGEAHSAAHMVMGLLRAYRGETRSARTHLETALLTSTRRHHAVILRILPWGWGVIHANDGNLPAALTAFRRIIDEWDPAVSCPELMGGLCAAAFFFADHQHTADLKKTIRILSATANETGNAEPVAGLSLALGLQALTNEQPDIARRQLLRAADSFRDLGTPLQYLETTLPLAHALFQTGQPTEAVEKLQETLVAAKRMGLRPLAARIEELLHQHGAPATESRKADSELREKRSGLTRRQFEVLTCMAEGLSNKEIATRLQLSTRTIDMHVGNILNRLNCRSRTEAVRVAGEMELI